MPQAITTREEKAPSQSEILPGWIACESFFHTEKLELA